MVFRTRRLLAGIMSMRRRATGEGVKKPVADWEKF
jgi:hypothetical protein